MFASFWHCYHVQAAGPWGPTLFVQVGHPVQDLPNDVGCILLCVVALLSDAAAAGGSQNDQHLQDDPATSARHTQRTPGSPIQELSTSDKLCHDVDLAWGDVYVVEPDAVGVVHLQAVRTQLIVILAITMLNVIYSTLEQAPSVPASWELWPKTPGPPHLNQHLNLAL